MWGDVSVPVSSGKQTFSCWVNFALHTHRRPFSFLPPYPLPPLTLSQTHTWPARRSDRTLSFAHFLLTLSYSSKINTVLCPQRVSLRLKKTSWFVLRGYCCLSSRVWQPATDSNVYLEGFKFKKKVRQTAITFWSSLSHPTRSLIRIVCRWKADPNGSKGTLRPDFQANTWPRLFKKSSVTTRYRKDVRHVTGTGSGLLGGIPRVVVHVY